MRKLYVPIGLDPEHNTKIYKDDFKRLGARTVFLVEPSRLLHLCDERYSSAMRFIKNNIEAYEALGYECGVWITTIGFGNALRGKDTVLKYTPIRSIVGDEMVDANCPTDKSFVHRMCEIVKDLARLGAKMIMLDDELCLSVRPGLGCACEEHLAEFGRRIGRKVSLRELPELLFTGKPSVYRREWLSMQGDTLRHFCKALRNALDEVDPSVRMGYCAGYTSYDVEGVDAIELTQILAGNTKPFLRLTSAPYWYASQRFAKTPMATFIEFARMQAAWLKNYDIEIFSECDTYPHDRFHTPVSYIQCFDTATRLTKNVGVLKYFYHYPCKPEVERGYINAHLAENKACEALESAFWSKNEVGVRVYEKMHKLADSTLPDAFNAATSQKWIMKKYSFSEAQMMLSVNAIPTVYEGKGVCGIAFGENAKYLDADALEKGLILDISAAEILQARGIDVGLADCKPLASGVLEDFGDGYGVSVFSATDLCDIKTAEGAKVISTFVSTDYLSEPRHRSPAAYLYENAKGQRFLVYAFRSQSQPETSGIYWNYRRGEQIAEAVEWLGGAPLPVRCSAEPFGYLRCNENENSVACAYFNCTADAPESLTFTFSKDVKNVNIIMGNGTQTDARTVTINDIRAYGCAAFVAEYV